MAVPRPLCRPAVPAGHGRPMEALLRLSIGCHIATPRRPHGGQPWLRWCSAMVACHGGPMPAPWRPVAADNDDPISAPWCLHGGPNGGRSFRPVMMAPWWPTVAARRGEPIATPCVPMATRHGDPMAACGGSMAITWLLHGGLPGGPHGSPMVAASHSGPPCPPHGQCGRMGRQGAAMGPNWGPLSWTTMADRHGAAMASRNGGRPFVPP